MRIRTCCGGVQMFKNTRLVVLFDMLLNTGFKMTRFAKFRLLFFFQTNLSFVLSRKVTYIHSDRVQKHGNVTVKDFRKYKKLKYKQNKLKSDIDFLNNCKQLVAYPKFLIISLNS